ncbi:hypothetical protein G5714_002910 [Onychostoma macrolepis]|uniref:Uncharacterized protein n=1 Tax=Onychostoma macrolepis TaxID=369639 RepID=A0A7J6D8B0_9TELE|nr:hypothetical protein G5714_002910 [Onychostoma macrolepis]
MTHLTVKMRTVPHAIRPKQHHIIPQMTHLTVKMKTVPHAMRLTQNHIIPQPSAKLLQSQLSTQLESSEQSDSSEELPPTPPNQLLWPAKKLYSPTYHQSCCPTRCQPHSPTSQHHKPSYQPHSHSTVTSPTARGVSSSIATITSPTCEAMFTKLLTILEEVKETQRVHGKMLNALLKKQDGSVVLPLKTQSDLEALDQKLGDRFVMSAVVTMVADVGGTSVDNATRRMMKCILSNELALEYNLFGRGKEANLGCQCCTGSLRWTIKVDFENLFRMDVEDFNHLLELMTPYITKQSTQLRQPISARDRLSIALRYLATGESFSSLSFQYYVERSTVGVIVKETYARRCIMS